MTILDVLKYGFASVEDANDFVDQYLEIVEDAQRDLGEHKSANRVRSVRNLVRELSEDDFHATQGLL